MTDATCSVEDCEKPAKSRGWCSMHAERWRKYGDVNRGHRTLEERLFSRVKIDRATGCWLWQGSRSVGYGQVSVGYTMRSTHRVVYEMLVGPIPDGLSIDHLCRNPPCCNPAHLEPVTPSENSRRGETGAHNKRKTHCPAGHPYEGANLRVNTAGSRVCRTCRRDNERRRRAKARRG